MDYYIPRVEEDVSMLLDDARMSGQRRNDLRMAISAETLARHRSARVINVGYRRRHFRTCQLLQVRDIQTQTA